MRLALNPIQWMASDDGWLDPSLASAREDLLSQVRKAGFDGVMAEVPAGWPVERYREVLDSLGLALAPGYAVCRADSPERELLATAAEVARQHAALGLADIGLGMGMRKDAPRERHPAQGHEADDARLAALIDRITEVMLAEGVRPAPHPMSRRGSRPRRKLARSSTRCRHWVSCPTRATSRGPAPTCGRSSPTTGRGCRSSTSRTHG